MRWYAGSILKIEGGRALVELDYHPGERASLGPSNIRIRKVQPPKGEDSVMKSAAQSTEAGDSIQGEKK